MEPTSQKRTDEIDIISFLSPIGRILKILVNTLSKNWLTVTLIVLLFTSLGYSARFILPRQYQTNSIILTHAIPSEVCIIEIENLNELISRKKDFAMLAKQLQISLGNAKEIVNMSAEKIQDENKDSSGQFFTINLRITNTDILDSVQAGIVQFLENNEYSRIRKERKRVSLNKLKQNLQKNIESLDSLKAVVKNSIIPRSSGQGIIFGEPINPVSIYEAEITYFKEQLEINEDLATLDNIEIIQPFIKVEKSNRPDFTKILVYSFLIGLIIAILFVLLFNKS